MAGLAARAEALRIREENVAAAEAEAHRVAEAFRVEKLRLEEEEVLREAAQFKLEATQAREKEASELEALRLIEEAELKRVKAEEAALEILRLEHDVLEFLRVQQEEQAMESRKQFLLEESAALLILQQENDDRAKEEAEAMKLRCEELAAIKLAYEEECRRLAEAQALEILQLEFESSEKIRIGAETARYKYLKFTD